MRLFIGDKLVEFNTSDLDKMYINEGNEGIVYRYDNQALKVYKEEQEKCRLDEEDSIKLSHIKTERILLPEQMLYDEACATFIGYTTPFVEKENIENILDLDVISFIDELDAINRDLEMLADNGVLVDDLDSINLLYNGKLFLGDPGSYMFVSSLPKQIYKSNVYQLNKFVKEDLFGMVDLSFEEQIMLDVVFDKYKYIGSQMKNDALSGENVSQYVKKMASK